jgi:hypothetical protein|eukprot:evm.model.NODE_38069_length_12343_cov_21.077129.1
MDGRFDFFGVHYPRYILYNFRDKQEVGVVLVESSNNSCPGTIANKVACFG